MAMIFYPCEESLHDPSSIVATKLTAIVGLWLRSVVTVQRYHIHALIAKIIVQVVAIISTVVDQYVMHGFDHVEVIIKLHRIHLNKRLGHP